jgi:hypothetical protein
MRGRGVSMTHASGAAAPRLGMRARRWPPSGIGRTRPSSSAAIMTVAVRMLFPFPSGAGAARLDEFLALNPNVTRLAPGWRSEPSSLC